MAAAAEKKRLGADLQEQVKELQIRDLEAEILRARDEDLQERLNQLERQVTPRIVTLRGIEWNGRV